MRMTNHLWRRPFGVRTVGEFVRTYRCGRRWYANFRNRLETTPPLGTTNKKVALRKALKIDTELAAGRWKESIAATVGEGIKVTSLSGDEGRALLTITKRHVLGLQVEARRSTAVASRATTPPLVDAYRKLRKDLKKGKKTVYTESVVIRQLVNFALSRKLLVEDLLAVSSSRNRSRPPSRVGPGRSAKGILAATVPRPSVPP